MITGVRIGAHSLEELQDDSPVVSLNRADVTALQTSSGFMAERLVAEVLFALVVLVIGLSVVRSLALWLLYGGTMEVHVAAVVALVPLGISMLARSLRRGWSVVATLSDGRLRRLALGRDRTLAMKFVEEARMMGWPIHTA